MRTIIVKPDFSFEEKKMYKTDFVREFSLNMRDLRPVFSILQVATILPREDAVIINLGFIKAILAKDVVYFLKQFESERFNNFFSWLIKKGKKEEVPEDKFFLFIFEHILDAKARQMSEKIHDLKEWVNKALPNIQNKLSEQSLKELLAIKKRISKLETRLKEILSATEEILEDEDNFEELSRISKRDNSDDLEVESILENFLEQIEDELGKINQLKEEIESTEEFMDLTLSSRRTKIVKFDLIATLITLTLSVLSVVVGFYGVNLYNGLEESKWAFKILGLFLIIFFILSTLVSLWILKKEKII